MPPAQQTETLSQFADYLLAVGTSTFGSVVDDMSSALAAQFGAAFGTGVAVAIAVMGALAVVASVIAWLGMGRSEAVVSVWEHRDERPGSMPDRGSSVPA